MYMQWCRCPSETDQPAHDATGEIDRAACPYTPEDELRRLYLPDPSVLLAVLRRDTVPGWLLSRCIDQALAYDIRPNDHMLPRPTYAINLFLGRADITRQHHRSIARFGNLAPSTILLVATHPLTEPDLVIPLAYNLYENSGIGSHAEGLKALQSGFGARGLVVWRFAKKAHSTQDLRLALGELDALGEHVVEAYGSLVRDWHGDEASLRIAAQALSANV